MVRIKRCSVGSSEVLQEKNILIQRTMKEKKQLVADILQIPVEEYDHIAEVSIQIMVTCCKYWLMNRVTLRR